MQTATTQGVLRVPLKAHTIGGNGIYEGCNGKLDLIGEITPAIGKSFGPTHFGIRESMIKLPKKVKRRYSKLLDAPKSIPLDGWSKIPDISKALQRMSRLDMKNEPAAATAPESTTEAYAGDFETIKEAPEEEENTVISKLKGYGRANKLGQMQLDVILESFELGMPSDGTLMMTFGNGDAIKGQFSRAYMRPTEGEGYQFLIPATIIGGYGRHFEAKGAVILDGKVELDADGKMGITTFEMDGDIITPAMVDDWKQQGPLRGR